MCRVVLLISYVDNEIKSYWHAQGAAPMQTKQLTTRCCALCLAIISIIVYSTPSHSTTAIVIVGENGIVIATDSKQVLDSHDNAGRQIKIGEKGARKVFLVQNHIAVATIGHDGYHIRHGDMAADYDFGEWILDIQHKLPDNIPFDEFVGIVYDSISTMMIPNIQPFLSVGEVPQRSDWDIFEPFARYIIAGFEKGVPKLCVLEFYIDWGTKALRGPYRIPIEPTSRPITGGRTRIASFGLSEAAGDFHTPQSYAYKREMACCAKVMAHLFSRAPLTLDESRAFATVLVNVEEQTNPGRVGGPVQIVEIPPTGQASYYESPTKTTRKTANAKK